MSDADRMAALETRMDRLEAEREKGRREGSKGYNADGTMRCPYARFLGERSCSHHTYSGCTW